MIVNYLIFVVFHLGCSTRCARSKNAFCDCCWLLVDVLVRSWASGLAAISISSKSQFRFSIYMLFCWNCYCSSIFMLIARSFSFGAPGGHRWWWSCNGCTRQLLSFPLGEYFYNMTKINCFMKLIINHHRLS